MPLLVALHGTGGDHNKYFDHEDYRNGIYKREAEKRGISVLCPRGSDAEGRPTEWRGVGELHVLAALEDVKRRFQIEPDRIICTGQSMGGTGTTYLCCRYPDVFAAGIPLASTYGHVSLVANLRDVPMFYVHGGKDWPIYAKTGPIPITTEMLRLGYSGSLWMIAESGHNTMDVSTERVIDWALKQRRVAHPRHITHRAYFPPHGRAWWVEIQEIERPGWFAEVDAQIAEDNRILVAVKNAKSVVLRPDSQLLRSEEPVAVVLDGRQVFRGVCDGRGAIVLSRNGGTWSASLESLAPKERMELSRFAIGTVAEPPTWEGGPETTLGNWLTDAMRDITGADIAIRTKGHYRYRTQSRGAEVQAGQTVSLVDLINWLRPLDSALATFKLRGADLLAIIEANIGDKPQDERFLVQVSGCRYRFDRRRPAGQRVVETDIDPQREYRIVCKSSDLTRTDTLHLGDYFEKLDHEILEPNVLSTAWYFAQKCDGRIAAKLEGRVAETQR
jgi:predicted esterase